MTETGKLFAVWFIISRGRRTEREIGDGRVPFLCFFSMFLSWKFLSRAHNFQMTASKIANNSSDRDE